MTRMIPVWTLILVIILCAIGGITQGLIHRHVVKRYTWHDGRQWAVCKCGERYPTGHTRAWPDKGQAVGPGSVPPRR